MTDLLLVADAAYPFDLAKLPQGVVAVLGYVGASGCTPHIWTAAERQQVVDSGRMWGPIWTPPQDGFYAETGKQAANNMAATLDSIGYSKSGPVFLDIERATYDAAPQAVLGGVAAWQAGMGERGWYTAVPYLPAAAKFGWIADWTGQRPASLPDNLMGQQYAGRVDGDSYDLSVFASHIFAGLTPTTGGNTMALDKADKAWLVAQLGTLQHNLDGHLTALHSGKGGGWDLHRNLVSVADDVATLLAETGKGGGVAVDVTTLASDLTALLGPALAVQLADTLAKRLAS